MLFDPFGIGVPGLWLLAIASVAVLVAFPLVAGRSLTRRLALIGAFWLCLIAISPLAFLLIALPPAIVVVNRRRRRLLQSQNVTASITGLPDELRPLVAAYEAAGQRFVTCISVKHESSSEEFAVLRLPDGAGWIELFTAFVEIQHAFGPRYLSTIPVYVPYGADYHLIQRCASLQMDDRILVHRRLLARLAKRGIRPDRLSDEEVVSVILRQASSDEDRPAPTGWWAALRHTILEELVYTERIGCRPIFEAADFDEQIDRWLRASDPRAEPR